MKTRSAYCLGCTAIVATAMLMSGCARFQHQTTESEPHGLVTVAKRSDLTGEICVVKKLDDLPVSAGETYRVSPGHHQVIVQFVDTVVETSEPVSLFKTGSNPAEQPVRVEKSATGRTDVYGEQPFSGTQPVRMSVEGCRIRFLTNSLTVKPGWRYLLEGDGVQEKPASPQ